MILIYRWVELRGKNTAIDLRQSPDTIKNLEMGKEQHGWFIFQYVLDMEITGIFQIHKQIISTNPLEAHSDS